MKKTIKYGCMATLMLAPLMNVQAQEGSQASIESAVKAANGDSAAIKAAVSKAVKAEKGSAVAIVTAAVKALGANPSPAIVADIVKSAIDVVGKTGAVGVGAAAIGAANNAVQVQDAVNNVVAQAMASNPLDPAGSQGGVGNEVGGDSINQVGTGLLPNQSVPRASKENAAVSAGAATGSGSITVD